MQLTAYPIKEESKRDFHLTSDVSLEIRNALWITTSTRYSMVVCRSFQFAASVGRFWKWSFCSISQGPSSAMGALLPTSCGNFCTGQPLRTAGFQGNSNSTYPNCFEKWTEPRARILGLQRRGTPRSAPDMQAIPNTTFDQPDFSLAVDSFGDAFDEELPEKVLHEVSISLYRVVILG